MAAKGPDWWANRGSLLLAQALGEERFPVEVERLALDWSKAIDPAEPITRIRGRGLEGFEGALIDGRKNGNGWGIVYDEQIARRSPGRMRFTIAHELGHYLLHRHLAAGTGFTCGSRDMTAWDYDRQPREVEANRFAAGILMPLNDFRSQLPARDGATMETLSELAEDRYGVSLTACILRWLDYTARQAILVASRDGYALWAKSSQAAFRNGRFIRTRNGPPFEIPSASPTMSSDLTDVSGSQVRHPSGVWFDAPVVEDVICSARLELNLSLLTFDGNGPATIHDDEGELDVLDRMKLR
ncbi:MAG: ImmA/IrrE family metallo-endopeptidase [Jannaschia sp.]